MTKRASLTIRLGAILLIAAELALFAWIEYQITNDAVAPSEVADTVWAGVPDLSRHRYQMRRAVRALREGDGATAMAALQVVDLADRPVDAYHRYYLANAYELLGRKAEARATLALMWRDAPRMAVRIDVAFHLAALYEETGDWEAADRVLRDLLGDDENDAVVDTAYRRARVAAVVAGDASRLVAAATRVTVNRPESTIGSVAAADLAALGGTLARPARIERLGRRADKGAGRSSLSELEELRREGTSIRLELLRARLLANQGKREEADRIVFAMIGANDTLDRQLLTRSWTWWSEAADEIEARSWRTIRVRRRTGTTRVKVGRRWVNKPVYTTTTRRVRRSLGRADRRRLESVNKTLVQRGERLLTLGVEPEMEKTMRLRLAGTETKPRRQERLEMHVRRLVELDPRSDDLLQLFWDEGWEAWKRRDFHTARERFAFIFRVYRRPDIQRQAQYWYARCLEESGERAEAARQYADLLDAPYEDLYALLAKQRSSDVTGNKRVPFQPFDTRSDDWIARAERDMPDELRLAWELSVLGLNHDARLEIKANANDANRTWVYSILARIHHAEGSSLLVGHALRRAYPEIGTVELDRVPPHFLKMYYPTRHHEHVEREARKRNLDPALVKGVILQESGYEPGAVSSAGATGLMQLMAPTAREIAPRVDLRWDSARLVDPSYNIAIGCYYLRVLTSEFGDDTLLSLAAYNGGIGNVRRWLRRELKGRAPDELVESIPFNETRGYIKRVVIYRSVYGRLAAGATE